MTSHEPADTTRALEVARGERAHPFVADDHAELLRRKRELHERAYLERLRGNRRHIVEITLGEPWDFEAAAEQTAEAMVAGAEIISPYRIRGIDGRRWAPHAAGVSPYTGSGGWRWLSRSSLREGSLLWTSITGWRRPAFSERTSVSS